MPPKNSSAEHGAKQRQRGREQSPPITFRLPKPLERDEFFGLSRAFYYNGEERGWWKLVRIRHSNKTRGVTLVPYAAVEKFICSRMGGAA
jgi:hypothetical protein